MSKSSEETQLHEALDEIDRLTAEVEELTHNYSLLNEELALRDSRDAEVIRMAEEIQLLRTQQAVEVSIEQ